MDPLDREKSWNAVEQIAVITLVIGLIYLIFRVAVVVPEWGWQLIASTTIVGVALYYFLAFRRGPDQTEPRRRALQFLVGALLVVAVMLPLWVVLYFAWAGGQFGR